jgi:hypothetical protein
MQGEADVAVAYNPTLPEWRNAERRGVPADEDR